MKNPQWLNETAVETVERGLDTYLTRMADKGIDPSGFKMSTLAAIADVPGRKMGQMLQQYRSAQARQVATDDPSRPGRRQQPTRYVIAARSYGPNARWRILAKPGSDPAVIRRARREQAKWIARDAYRRLVSDLVHELYPGLSDTQADRHVAEVMEFASGQFEGVVGYVDKVLERRRGGSALVEANRSA